jgi:hypothetical protein
LGEDGGGPVPLHLWFAASVKEAVLGEDILVELLPCIADSTCPIPGIKWWMRHVNPELYGGGACNSRTTWFSNQIKILMPEMCVVLEMRIVGTTWQLNPK